MSDPNEPIESSFDDPRQRRTDIFRGGKTMTDGRTDDERCPHCGAEWSNSTLTFACGSYERSDGIKRHQHCYEREIAALQAELAKRQWQPIETAPLDVPLQLAWLESWPEKKWVQEVDLAGHENDKGPGMSNAWLHGRATHWQPLPEPPKEL